MDSTNGKDPFDLLLNAGSSPDLLVLVGGPTLLLVIIIAIYAVLVFLRNRRERAALTREVESAAAQPEKELQAGEEPEDFDQPQEYEIPENLESEPLGDEEIEPPAEFMRAGAAPARPQLRVVPPPEAPAPGAPRTPAAPADVEEVRRTGRDSWLARLASGLARTRDTLRGNIQGLFTGKAKIDAGMLERLHEALYRADIGAATADKLVDHVRQTLGKDSVADWEQVSRALKDHALSLLQAPEHKPLTPPERGPWVLLVIGVNGVGKTTTIGKLAAHFLAEDKTVLLGAADTFRAAAIEQLSVWGERLGVGVVKHKQGGDPAAVAYDAVKAAMARKTDVLLIDTAGRLHARTELMAELGKINRVIGKDLPGAPHETWLVIDATTGQNAIMQVKAFSEVAKVTGLIVTKLDGTAKGGVLLGIVDQFKLPVRYIGVGEKAADLHAFNAADYVESLF